MERWTGLLDCNNFFVSCERLFRPDLERVPVAVLSSNDGCIVARSQEIKDMNIPMGVPYFQVKDILKTSNAVLFSGNHQLYRALSKRVFSVMREVYPDIEQYSIDEAFFYFTGTREEVEEMATNIQKQVQKQVGIPVSVGVSRSKTLAKVAGEKAKKEGGVVVLEASDWGAMAAEYPLGKVWGVGRRLTESFKRHNLLTANDLRVADSERIRNLYGVVGSRLQQEVSGEVVQYSSSSKPKQSLMSSRSFRQEIMKIDAIKEAVLSHVEEVAYQLRQTGQAAHVISVFISPSRYSDFSLQNKTGERVLEIPISSTKEIAREAVSLCDELFAAAVPYKKVGVRLSRLVSREVEQLALFMPADTEGSDNLQIALDALNSRFATGKVHQGFLEGRRAYTAKSENRSPAYVSSWDQVPTVKA